MVSLDLVKSCALFDSEPHMDREIRVVPAYRAEGTDPANRLTVRVSAFSATSSHILPASRPLRNAQNQSFVEWVHPPFFRRVITLLQLVSKQGGAPCR